MVLRSLTLRPTVWYVRDERREGLAGRRLMSSCLVCAKHLGSPLSCYLSSGCIAYMLNTLHPFCHLPSRDGNLLCVRHNDCCCLTKLIESFSLLGRCCLHNNVKHTHTHNKT